MMIVAESLPRLEQAFQEQNMLEVEILKKEFESMEVDEIRDIPLQDKIIRLKRVLDIDTLWNEL
jgi:hypothetical protein